jgi:hypothetical protein
MAKHVLAVPKHTVISTEAPVLTFASPQSAGWPSPKAQGRSGEIYFNSFAEGESKSETCLLETALDHRVSPGQ